jgi:hypothetical protein
VESAVITLRELWRRRLLVLAAALIAASVGVMVAYRPGLPPESRQYHVGLASTDVLIDTPNSQVVSLKSDPEEGNKLEGRASLLASVIAANPLRTEIAHRSGVDPNSLAAVPPTTDAGPSPLSTAATKTPTGATAHVLTLHVDTTLPIISVVAQAPDTETAARLSNGAVAVLKDHLRSVATTQKVPHARQLVVKQLGAARTAKVTRGPRRLYALLLGILIFTLACAAILMIPRLARGWRQLDAVEREPIYPRRRPPLALLPPTISGRAQQVKDPQETRGLSGAAPAPRRSVGRR